jgi:amidase
MSSSRKEVDRVAAAVGYTIPESEVDDYEYLLGRAKATFDTVEAMDGLFSPQ